MKTTSTNRSSGCFRGYTNEQKTLRAKLDHLLKWTRDLKTNIMKQSIKVLQTNINREIVDQIHDDLDEYKRKFDRELGRIHDICDALTNNQTQNGDEKNLQDEILEALRRSPTYTSLEQHIYDDKCPRIRVKPREKVHPGKNHRSRTPISTDTIKRKASQPITVKVLDTSGMSSGKRRSQVDAFKRSRSFTNIEHKETQLGMDYIEEDESDLSWKPFGPKRTISKVSLTSNNDDQQSTDSIPTSQSLPTISTEKSKPSSSFDNDSSDEEFDVAWQRRAKQKAQKEVLTTPAKRTVRFAPSTNDPDEIIEIDLDEKLKDDLQSAKDQNNNNNNNKNDDTQQTCIVNLDDEDEITISLSDIQNETTKMPTTLSQQGNNQDDDSQIIDDSDDEIIALSDDEISSKSNIKSRKVVWTTSEIQITNGNSQSQTLHNPYRVGIADPSIRSIFLPPPNSQTMSELNNRSRKGQNSNRKTSSARRTNN